MQSKIKLLLLEKKNINNENIYIDTIDGGQTEIRNINTYIYTMHKRIPNCMSTRDHK